MTKLQLILTRPEIAELYDLFDDLRHEALIEINTIRDRDAFQLTITGNRAVIYAALREHDAPDQLFAAMETKQ